MNPVVLDDVNASALVLTAVADDDVLLLSVCVDGLGVTVLGILVNTSVVAVLVAEKLVAEFAVLDVDGDELLDSARAKC